MQDQDSKAKARERLRRIIHIRGLRRLSALYAREHSIGSGEWNREVCAIGEMLGTSHPGIYRSEALALRD